MRTTKKKTNHSSFKKMNGGLAGSTAGEINHHHGIDFQLRLDHTKDINDKSEDLIDGVIEEEFESEEEEEEEEFKSEDEKEVKKKRSRSRGKRQKPSERKYVCPFETCGKSFFYSHHLKKHMKIHEENGRPEECIICGARFAKKSSLRTHISITHAKNPERDGTTREAIDAILKCKPYTCSHNECQRSFATEGQLQKHLKRHEEKRHICGKEGCGKSFAFRKELLKHIKNDHKITPEDLICKICNTKFKNIHILNQHISAMHNKPQQQYVCPHEGCSKVYNKKGNLNWHIRICHNKEEEGLWVCRICNQNTSYATRYILARHYRNIHKKSEQFIKEEIGKVIKREKLRTRSKIEEDSNPDKLHDDSVNDDDDDGVNDDDDNNGSNHSETLNLNEMDVNKTSNKENKEQIEDFDGTETRVAKRRKIGTQSRIPSSFLTSLIGETCSQVKVIEQE